MNKTFTLEFQEKTSIYERNRDGLYEEKELYYLVGAKTMKDVFSRKTGRVFTKKCGPDIEEQILPLRNEKDVLMYDSSSFLPFLLEPIE